MGTFFSILIIVGIVLYLIEMIMEPEKHKPGLIFLAIIAAFISAFGGSSKKSRRR